MAHKVRPRLHYPGVWSDSHKHEKIGLPAFTLWQYLVDHADDDGRLPIMPAVLAAQAYLLVEGQPRPVDEVERYLATLEERRLIRTYMAGGARYCELHDWADFQKVRARDYKPSTYPGPPDGSHLAANRQPLGSHPASKCQPSGIPNVKDNVNVNDNDNGGPRVRAVDSRPVEPEAPGAPATASLAPVPQIAGSDATAELAGPDPAPPAVGVDLGRLLQAELRAAHPAARPTFTMHDAEALRVVAGQYPVPELVEVIRWAARHPHWGPVLLARGGIGAKFREHAQQLHARWRSESSRRSPEEEAREQWRRDEHARLERNKVRADRQAAAARGPAGGADRAPGARASADFTTAGEALTGILANLGPKETT